MALPPPVRNEVVVEQRTRQLVRRWLKPADREGDASEPVEPDGTPSSSRMIIRQEVPGGPVHDKAVRLDAAHRSFVSLAFVFSDDRARFDEADLQRC
jgi:hypothetical protein